MTDYPPPFKTRNDDRSIEYRWHTGIEETDLDRTGEQQIELSISHDKTYRRYVARLSIVTVFGNYEQRKFSMTGPAESTRIMTEYVSRYNAKGLAAFAARALNAVVHDKLLDETGQELMSRVTSIDTTQETAS